mmetsp:Transcript_11084/g.44648  ORF Transcript_11084/g.44648 Transcript_11084/m.44648 type:complete len:230 (+) Transcript_11084:1045-1734(+)
MQHPHRRGLLDLQIFDAAQHELVLQSERLLRPAHRRVFLLLLLARLVHRPVRRGVGDVYVHGGHGASIRRFQRRLHRRSSLRRGRRVRPSRVVNLQDERPPAAEHAHVDVLPPSRVQLAPVRAKRPGHDSVQRRLNGTLADRDPSLGVDPRRLGRTPGPLQVPTPDVRGLAPRQHANRRANLRGARRRRHQRATVPPPPRERRDVRELTQRDALRVVVPLAVVLPRPRR